MRPGAEDHKRGQQKNVVLPCPGVTAVGPQQQLRAAVHEQWCLRTYASSSYGGFWPLFVIQHPSMIKKLLYNTVGGEEDDVWG